MKWTLLAVCIGFLLDLLLGRSPMAVSPGQNHREWDFSGRKNAASFISKNKEG